MLKYVAKKTVIVSIIVFLVFACQVTNALQTELAKENAWITKSSSIPTREPMVIGANGKVYTIGGMNIDSCSNYTQEYDPKTDKWTNKASMPTARADAAIALYQNKIFVIGGTTGAGVQVRYGGGDTSLIGTSNACEAYNPTTDSWEIKSAISTNLSYIQAGVVGDKIYVIGGDKNLMYDVSQDRWTYKSPPPVAVWKYALAVVNNSLYLFGGVTSPQSHSWSNISQIYDTQRDSWSFGQALPESFVFPVAAQTTGENAAERVYVISWVNRTHIYDPSNDSWADGAQMLTQRAAFGATVVDDLLYVIGGGSGTFPTLYPAYGFNEQYTPTGYRKTRINLTASPSPTPNPTPALSTAPLSTPTLTSSPSQQPTPEPSQSPSISELPFWILFPLVLLIVILVVCLTKKMKPYRINEE